MDPLSIVASSTALLMTCGKAVFLLHNFISGTKEVHSTITTLHADITSLSELLEDLKVLFARGEIADVVDAQMDNFGGRVWRRAEGILESVGATLRAVEKLIEKIGGKGKGKEVVDGGGKVGFMKRGWMQLKVEFRTGDFELRHRQLQTQRSTLQIFLASITLCLQVHAESEQATATDNILASIASLKQDVKNLDPVEIRQRLDDSTTEHRQHNNVAGSTANVTAISNPFDDQLSDPFNLEAEIPTAEQIETETELMLEQLEDTLESAKEVIYSAQASIASRREGSVRSNASVAVSEQGSLFNLASRQRVGNWVTGNVIEEESSSDSDQGEDTKVIDFEAIISKRLQEKGDSNFELQQFAEAENVFRLSLRHYEKATMKTDTHRAELKLKLALARAKQERWDGIEELLSSFLKSSIEETKSSDVLTAWHLVAEYKFSLGLLKEAETTCRQVMTRRRMLLRKRDPVQEESMQLLVQISQAKSAKLDEKAEELRSHGIDIDSPSYDVNVELRKAALDGSNVQLLELLLSLPDADIHSTCEDGLPVVAYAWTSPRSVAYPFLVRKGAVMHYIGAGRDGLEEWNRYFTSIPTLTLWKMKCSSSPKHKLNEWSYLVGRMQRFYDMISQKNNWRSDLEESASLCAILQSMSSAQDNDLGKWHEILTRLLSIFESFESAVTKMYQRLWQDLCAFNRERSIIGQYLSLNRDQPVSNSLLNEEMLCGEAAIVDSFFPTNTERRLLSSLSLIIQKFQNFAHYLELKLNCNPGEGMLGKMGFKKDIEYSREFNDIKVLLEPALVSRVESFNIIMTCVAEEIQHLHDISNFVNNLPQASRPAPIQGLAEENLGVAEEELYWEKWPSPTQKAISLKVLKTFRKFNERVDPLIERQRKLRALYTM